MSKVITVILARAGWCGHCQHFEPIFEETKKNYKKDNFLNKHKINFVDYDLATDEGKNNFTLNHFEALKMVEGYPTVIVNVYEKEKKDNKYYTISHTVVDDNIKNDFDKKKDASGRFLNNVSNLIKSLESDNKILYMQTGGSMNNNRTSLQEEMYRIKYLKYKTKYIGLKINKNI